MAAQPWDIVGTVPATRKQPEAISAVIVDPSCFSLPYDHSLCTALTQLGHRVVLARGEPAYPVLDGPVEYDHWVQFYKGVRSWRGRVNENTWKLLKGGDHLLSMQRFVGTVRDWKPDVVHFQWLPLPLVDGFFLKQLAQATPLVLTLHNTTLFHGSPSSRLQGIGFRQALRHFSALIVHTRFSRQQVIARGWVAAEKIHVIPHGLLDCYTELGKPAADSREPVILFFGALKPYKGVDTLIRAFAQYAGTHSSGRLVIAGMAQMDPAPLRNLALELNVQHRITWLLRYIPDRELATLFRSATVVALPYREIDQSGVLLSAIAFVKPVIATRVGGIPETVRDGVHGCLVNAGDSAAFAEALGRLLSNPEQLNAMRAQLVQLGRGELKWSNIAEQTAGLYKSVA